MVRDCICWSMLTVAVVAIVLGLPVVATMVLWLLLSFRTNVLVSSESCGVGLGSSV